MALTLGRYGTSKHAQPGVALTRGALFALYGTSSDDIGLGTSRASPTLLVPALPSKTSVRVPCVAGLPVLSVLYPDRVDSLYVLSAMQNLLFNPLAFVLLGLGSAHTAASTRDGSRPAVDPTTRSHAPHLCSRPILLFDPPLEQPPTDLPTHGWAAAPRHAPRSPRASSA
jgi:hypothetical protein